MSEVGAVDDDGEEVEPEDGSLVPSADDSDRVPGGKSESPRAPSSSDGVIRVLGIPNALVISAGSRSSCAPGASTVEVDSEAWDPSVATKASR